MPKTAKAKGKKGAAQDSATIRGGIPDGGMEGMMPKERELVEVRVRAKFTKFIPRFQVNADKLELVFEVPWQSIPEGFLDHVQLAVRQFGDLTWTESKVQKVESKDEKEQGKLDLVPATGGNGEIG